MPVEVIVFGGTSEGRKLARMLAGAKVRTMFCVAANYDEKLIVPQEYLSVTAERTSADAMAKMIAGNGCKLVVDATHPYAREAAANVREACSRAGAELLRLVRGDSTPENVTVVETAQQAVDLLNQGDGRALLTLGSKELHAFTAVRDYKMRLFVRVLPTVDVLQKCIALGFSGNRLICMQGPFTQELNAATIRMLGVSCVVTKDSGRVGGLFEKIAAVQETGSRLILIKRPDEPEQGLDYDAVCLFLAQRFGFEFPREFPPQPLAELPPRFPLFVELAGKRAVVVGGGEIAYRRVKTLLEFGADIRVISPELSTEMAAFVREDRITWLQSAFAPQLVGVADILVAATKVREINREVAEYAKEMRILVSIADDREASSFLFPSIVKTRKLVAGIVPFGNDYAAVKKIARTLREGAGENM